MEAPPHNLAGEAVSGGGISPRPERSPRPAEPEPEPGLRLELTVPTSPPPSPRSTNGVGGTPWGALRLRLRDVLSYRRAAGHAANGAPLEQAIQRGTLGGVAAQRQAAEVLRSTGETNPHRLMQVCRRLPANTAPHRNPGRRCACAHRMCTR